MTKTYQKFKKLPINFSAIGLEQDPTANDYFCTPKGANIIGWAGVDGIHYCFLEGFGDMVFAVSPCNLPGAYVHPLAESFEDFLRLLLMCSGLDAMEQVHGWSKETFEQYMAETRVSIEQKEIFQVIAEELHLEPMDFPFEYIKNLQSRFNYKSIPWKEEYREYVPEETEEACLSAGEEEGETQQEIPWHVCFGAGIRHHNSKDKPGTEISVEKEFVWNENRYYIPSVYYCSKGLVIDFCIEVEVKKIKDFLEKGGWAEQPEQEQWIQHYHLDRNKGWVFYRYSFAWATIRKPQVKSINLTMKAHTVSMTAKRFATPAVGESVTVTRPLTGEEYVLTVQEIENQEMDSNRIGRFHQGDLEFPTHYKTITYTMAPDLPGNQFMIQDVKQSDQPRRNLQKAGKDGTMAASIAIIGGADGPTSVFLLHNAATVRPHSACSGLRFEPVQEVEWKAMFHEKLCADLVLHIEDGVVTEVS